MKKIFNKRYFYALIGILLSGAYFFEYVISNVINNTILLLSLELIYDLFVLYISILYISKSQYFKESIWMKPKAATYVLICLIVLFTIKTFYDLIVELFL